MVWQRLLAAALLIVFAVSAGPLAGAVPDAPRPVTLAKCTGSSTCKACKTCSSCKHCAKDGQSCGVCRR